MISLANIDIIQAQTEAEIEDVRALFREYQAFLGVDLCFQGFEKELSRLPGDYAPPDGILLLAVANRDEAAGCGGLRKLDDQTCEMKRLFVRPEFRGLGLGMALARRLIDEAICLGYSRMLLDTLDRLNAAIQIYETLGFTKTAPYYKNPLPGVTYWELNLSATKAPKAQ